MLVYYRTRKHKIRAKGSQNTYMLKTIMRKNLPKSYQVHSTFARNILNETRRYTRKMRLETVEVNIEM